MRNAPGAGAGPGRSGREGPSGAARERTVAPAAARDGVKDQAAAASSLPSDLDLPDSVEILGTIEEGSGIIIPDVAVVGIGAVGQAFFSPKDRIE